MTRMAITITCAEDRERAVELVKTLSAGMRVEVKQAKRSPDQNDLMWARLRDISEQVEWPMGHKMVKLTPEDFKDIFSAGLRHARIVPSIDGDGFVQLGLHTSDLTKDEMSNLLDLMDAFAAERGVVFKEHNSSGDQSNDDQATRPDAPAGEPLPCRTPAGATIREEASLLSDDWRSVYITQMTAPTTRAMSVMTRDTNALQMIGGTPSDLERAWMRCVATLTVKRDKGKLKANEFETELVKLRDLPLSALSQDDAA